MAVENVGSFPEGNERMAEKALQALDNLGIEWRGRDVKAIAADLCDKIVPLFSSKTAEAASETSVDLTKMKTEVVQLAELLAQEFEADEESSRIFYFDPVSGSYQVVLAAQKHHKHKKRKWWVIGGIVAVVAAAIVITIATGGGAGPAAQNGAGTAIASLLATNPGKKEEDKKKDNPHAAPPPNNPPPPKPVAETKPASQASVAQIPRQTQAVTKSQPASAANVPPVVKHAEVAKAKTASEPMVHGAVPKQESVPVSKVQTQTNQASNTSPIVIHQKITETASSNTTAKEANITAENFAKHIASQTVHAVWKQMGQAKIEAANLGNKLGEVVNKALPGALHTNNLDEVREKIDQGHKAIDKVMGTNMASRYDTNAPPSKITKLEVPLPGVSIFTKAGQAGRIAKVAEATNGLKTTAIAEEASLVSRATQVTERSALEARAGSAANRALKQEVKTVNQTSKASEATQKQISSIAENFSKNPNIGFFENNLKHIFRNAPGHFADTPANRQLLINTALNRKNYLGKDKFGNEWYTKILDDGSQTWVQVADGKIRNGGLNQVPRTFDSLIISE